MKYVRDVLEFEGASTEEMGVHDALRYSRDGFYDLGIEKVGDEELLVGQYFTQRMDLMRAPEVVFDTSGGNGDWTPVEYTNHESLPQVYRRDESGVDGLGELLDTWESNLRGQYPVERLDEFRSEDSTL